jgi:2-hydroxychromene-2-carboxylate isomerase
VPFRHHGLERVNSVAASRAFLWLKREDPGRAVPFARRMFDRLWVRGADITPVQASAEEAAALGADAAALRAALEQPEAKQALKDEVDAALARGVFGVPFFIADGEAFWGSDRLPMLEHWLEHRRWDPVR